MKFAKIVFRIAGIWGVLVADPALFHVQSDRPQRSPAHHPSGFFYGFVGAALAWQFAFFIIATDPARYRPADDSFRV